MTTQSPVAPPDGAGFAAPQVFPNGPLTDADVTTIKTVAQQAEALGYDSIWTQEQIVGQSRSLEPVSLLSYLAAVTTHVRLGTSVIVLPLRNPVQLAKSLATADVLSGGRLTVGVGLGGQSPYLPAFGIPEGRRVRRFTEALRVMYALWEQSEAHLDGEFFRLEGTPMEPKPVQKPRPPVWFGARSEPALRRALRYGDGWMGPGSTSLSEFKSAVADLKRLMEEAGRSPSDFQISKRVYVAIDDDEGRAARRLEDWFEHHYGNRDMARRVSVFGPARQCHEQIEEIVDAGARRLLFNPVFDYDEHLHALATYTGGRQV
ncbi:MAG: LLM class flavin-dependent oxidoreductase [Chloroflexota bacterium]